MYFHDDLLSQFQKSELKLDKSEDTFILTSIIKINYLREKYLSMEGTLFPMVEEELGELTASQGRLLVIFIFASKVFKSPVS